jgi:hypothetical protein
VYGHNYIPKFDPITNVGSIFGRNGFVKSTLASARRNGPRPRSTRLRKAGSDAIKLRFDPGGGVVNRFLY